MLALRGVACTLSLAALPCWRSQYCFPPSVDPPIPPPSITLRRRCGHCWRSGAGKCHGPDKPKGGLRLDSAEGVARGGNTGAAINPGKPDVSLLIQAVRQTGDLKMPPKEKLTDREIADLVAWVRAGAPWPA